MTTTPVYEQVSAGTPQELFVASGLYRLAGHMRDKQFVRSQTGGELRTLDEWKRLDQARTMALPAQQPDQKWRCPQCLTYLPITLDERGQYAPCSVCGYAEWRGLEVPLTFDPPATMERVVKLQASGSQVAEYEPVGVVARRVPPPPARQTCAPQRQTMDGVVALQIANGQREPMVAPLHVMESVRCPCCGSPDSRRCPCPPPPPDTLGIAVQRGQERDQRQAAALLAAHPKLEHWKARS